MILITKHLKRVALCAASGQFFSEQFKSLYNIEVSPSYDPIIIRQVYLALQDLPSQLVKDCGITKLIVKYLGISKPLYPNHGFYRPSDKTVTMNSDIYYHPDIPEDFIDEHRYYMARPKQTLTHEFFHGFDHNNARNGIDLSYQEDWFKLSGWSEEYKPGLKRLVIKDKGAPEVIGEMFYDPKIAKFVRYYARRNCYDDFADTASFYICGLRDKVPSMKREYFDNLLGKYYGR